MRLEYLPLLAVQRDLYRLPRGPERFREYLRTMIDADTGDLALPLTSMNPMGKDHIPPFLDGLLALDADGEGARAAAHAETELRESSGDFKVGQVVCDDLKGGWTNRYATELSHRFEQGSMYKRGWMTGLLWTSETYRNAGIREEILACAFRAAYIQKHGRARTLAERLAQEAHAMSRAGMSMPILEPGDLTYTREILAPLMESLDPSTHMAALFGDPAARELGLKPLGLSPWAGLALALQDARG